MMRVRKKTYDRSLSIADKKGSTTLQRLKTSNHMITIQITKMIGKHNWWLHIFSHSMSSHIFILYWIILKHSLSTKTQSQINTSQDSQPKHKQTCVSLAQNQAKRKKSLTLYRLPNWRNRDVMAGGEQRDRRHHLIILFNESQGTPQPDCSGMQVNQRHVATNEEVSAAASC